MSGTETYQLNVCKIQPAALRPMRPVEVKTNGVRTPY